MDVFKNTRIDTSSGNGMTVNSNAPGSATEDGFVEVWAKNLEDVFFTIRQIILKYPYVAMDTEFPGVVERPIRDLRSAANYQYQLVKCNVNLLKLIQLGLTFYDEAGNKPPGASTFQFNFKFNLNEDRYAEDSIKMLQQAGIQFKRLDEEGISVIDFAELVKSSGLLTEDVTWIAFGSCFDFGYLLRALTNQKLPERKSDFFQLLSIFFSNVYDVKYLMKSCKSLKGGLQEVADQLKLKRVGTQHQAGSDSFITGSVFFKIKEEFFDDHIDKEKYCGNLFGLGNTYTQPSLMAAKTGKKTY